MKCYATQHIDDLSISRNTHVHMFATVCHAPANNDQLGQRKINVAFY